MGGWCHTVKRYSNMLPPRRRVIDALMRQLPWGGDRASGKLGSTVCPSPMNVTGNRCRAGEAALTPYADEHAAADRPLVFGLRRTAPDGLDQKG